MEFSWKLAIRTFAVCLVTLGSWASFGHAANLYGDFEGQDVWYRDVQEANNSPPPATEDDKLFGEPEILVNTLVFDPIAFNAAATGDGADSNELTDGQLKFHIEAKPLVVINNFLLSEAGDTTLSGNNATDNTSTSVTTTVFVRVLETTNGAITPISRTLVADAQYGLATDGQGSNLFTDDWTTDVFVDVDQILADEGVSGSATRISINLDNTLTANSELGTSSQIAKKQASGVTIVTNVPEPASCVIALTGLLGAVALLRGRNK